jgi:hypothetical protein
LGRVVYFAISSLEQLDWDKIVDGMAVDHASIPSKSCKSCIKAKHPHLSFPKEAKHYLEIIRECIMSDVWGPTTTRSSKGYYYCISFTDDAKRFSNVKFLVDKKHVIPQIKEQELINQKFGKYPK